MRLFLLFSLSVVCIITFVNDIMYDKSCTILYKMTFFVRLTTDFSKEMVLHVLQTRGNDIDSSDIKCNIFMDTFKSFMSDLMSKHVK